MSCFEDLQSETFTELQNTRTSDGEDFIFRSELSVQISKVSYRLNNCDPFCSGFSVSQFHIDAKLKNAICSKGGTLH